MKNVLRGLATVMAAALVATGCSSGAQPSQTGSAGASGAPQKVFKLGHIAAPDTAYDNFAKDFKQRLEEKSGGRYSIQIYPAGQLGVDRELMESLQNGNVDMTIITASDINQFVPDMAVQDLPFVFRDWDHVEKYLASPAATELFSLTDAVGMKTLAFMPRGFRNVTSNIKPINTPDDLKGLKIRVAESEVYIQTFKALGANAQAMAWGEVFTALQQKTIDAHENTVVTTRDYKIYEVQKYMSETQHFFAFAALQMNLNQFKGLSEADQKMIQEAATVAAKEMGLKQKNAEATAKAEMEAKGMVFNAVADKAPFKARVQPVIEDYFKKHDKKYYDAIQAIQ
nr:TRAP transporter substrate-binding protein [Propionibacterium sp.]